MSPDRTESSNEIFAPHRISLNGGSEGSLNHIRQPGTGEPRCHRAPPLAFTVKSDSALAVGASSPSG
jgi:hypothetical protein